MPWDARLPLCRSRPLPVMLTDAEGRLAIRSSYDVSPGPAPTVDQKLTVDLEGWRGLVLVGNGLSGLSPTDIPLVDNGREKFRKILTSVCLSRIPASLTQLGLNLSLIHI